MLSPKNVYRCSALLKRLKEIESWRDHCLKPSGSEIVAIAEPGPVSVHSPKNLKIPREYLLQMMDLYEASIRKELKIFGVNPDLIEEE